jgi:hypothetical protein
MRGSANKIGDNDKLLGKVVGFVNDNPNKPIYEITKEIKVKIIDWNKVVEKLKEQDADLSDSDWEVRAGNGIIFVGENKVPVLIDHECCGVDSEKKNMMLDGKMVSGTILEGIGLFQVHKQDKEGSRTISMMPKFYVDFDYIDVEKCFTGEEKELWDFMGSRYEYNPRIHSNLRGIVELYKGIEKR